jgi:DNA-binding protein H-NS
MTDLDKLSINELQTVIENAEKALKLKQANERKEIIAKIKELAASIDVIVDIHEHEKKTTRKGGKVAAKYRHPDDPAKTWTGRGVTPKWMQVLLESGRQRSEFEIN